MLLTATFTSAMKLFGYAFLGAWILGICAFIVVFFGLFSKTRERIIDRWGVYYTKYTLWKRLRPYRRHIKGINFEKVFPDGMDKEDLSGQARAYVMMRDMVENNTPVSSYQIVEAQLHTTAEHHKDALDSMMFTLEMVKTMKRGKR